MSFRNVTARPDRATTMRWLRHARYGFLIATSGLVMLGCHGLLDTTNPTLVQDSDIANAAGANARRIDVSGTFNLSLGSVVRDVALFTDEWRIDRHTLVGAQQPSDQVLLDRRDVTAYELKHTSSTSTDDPHLGRLDQIVTKADIAIPMIRAYTPDSLRGDYLAQLFALKSYAILQMAEDICSGFPINEVKDNLPVFLPPYSTDSAMRYAVAQADSALAYAKDSTRFLNLARVVRGRALLGLGQYAAAAAAVQDVPTDFVYETESNNAAYIAPGSYCSSSSCERVVVGDREGGTGIPFVSANDTRTPTALVGASLIDGTVSVYRSTKYASLTSPIAVAGGVEARLIEAEVALHGNDPTWFSILNTLRTTMATPALPEIATMPATTAEQVDLLYAERAFWLYLTGRRLGDLRRLISGYGRAPTTVFPTGGYFLGGTYQSATAIPFVFATERAQNPALTSGCAAQ